MVLLRVMHMCVFVFSKQKKAKLGAEDHQNKEVLK